MYYMQILLLVQTYKWTANNDNIFAFAKLCHVSPILRCPQDTNVFQITARNIQGSRADENKIPSIVVQRLIQPQDNGKIEL